jgi:hypothetical protein
MQHRIRALWVLSLLPCLAFGQDLAKGQPTIASIAAQGTNLVLMAIVPAEFGQVTLEMRPTLNTAWQAAGTLDVATGGGQLTFAIQKPGDMQFFRLRATSNTASAGVVSPELNYVTIASLGPDTGGSARGWGNSSEPEAVFHFRGMVDGSDRILITRDGAFWEHAHWGWPEGTVNVNRTQWDPRQKNYLTTTGTAKFVPEAFSLEAVDLERIKGRDVVALERTNNALIVYLDDTPAGADEYEFKIHFHTARPKPYSARASTPANLKIAAEIDGSDCLRITAGEASWEHKHWSGPANLKLNGVAWPVEQINVLQNTGTNRYLPQGVDLSTARIVSYKGRDLATLWAGKQELSVWFADNPNGSDHYELEISFGQQEQ